MEQINYIKRLCQVAKEKSLFGYHSDSAYYFQKAIAIAETSNQFLCITEAIYKADLQNNKILAYTAFLKSLDVAKNPVSQFRKTLKRKDLMPIISEFVAKMPDMLFYHIMIQTDTDQERMELIAIFEPISKSLSEQFSFFPKYHAIRKAS